MSGHDVTAAMLVERTIGKKQVADQRFLLKQRFPGGAQSRGFRKPGCGKLMTQNVTDDVSKDSLIAYEIASHYLR